MVTVVKTKSQHGIATDEHNSTLNLKKVQIVDDLTSIQPHAYDSIDITYITTGNGVGEVGTVTYKLATVTVATLTLTYDVNNNLISVVRV